MRNSPAGDEPRARGRGVAAGVGSGDPWYVEEQLPARERAGPRQVLEGRWAAYRRMVLGWLPGRPPGRVLALDAGCGDGLNLAPLADILREEGVDFGLHGVDYNPLRLSRAGAACAAGAANGLAGASLLALPFPAGTFDLVLCSQVLEHVPDDSAALAELARVAAPGALLVVGVPNEGCLLGRLRNRVVQPRLGRTTDHVHFYTARGFARLLGAAGLQVLSLEREGFFTPHLGLHQLVSSRGAGRRALALLGRLFPSQAAGLLAAARKAAGSGEG